MMMNKQKFALSVTLVRLLAINEIQVTEL